MSLIELSWTAKKTTFFGDFDHTCLEKTL